MPKKPVAIISNATEDAGPGLVAMLAAEGFHLVCDDRTFASPTVRVGYEEPNVSVVSRPRRPHPSNWCRTIERFGEMDAIVGNEFATIDGGAVDKLGAPAFRAACEALTVTPFRLCAAANALARCLALELAPFGVQVNAVALLCRASICCKRSRRARSAW